MNATELFSHIHPHDFPVIFETKGTSFIFQEIVARHYMPVGESLGIYNGKSVKESISNTLVAQVRETGLHRSPQETKKAISLLTQSTKEAISEAKLFSRNKIISHDEALRTFALFAKIMRQYEYFDAYYWDAAYESRSSDAQENVNLVQGFKNVIRESLNIIFFGKESFFEAFLAKIADGFGISTQTIFLYTQAEVMKLFDGKRVDRSILDSRGKAYVFLRKSVADVFVLSGDEALRWISAFDKAWATVSQEIKGMVAHGRGRIVRGKVRIITREYADTEVMYKRIEEMEKGEILVSETTDPEMIPAFKKAAAVITNVGGMLSHAAITSRELNLPAIVNTKIATKLLKTGDMVEVDTNKGVVIVLDGD